MTMTRPYIIITLAALPLMFSSCIKDEPLGMECDIEEAFIHADDPQAMFFQPSDSLTRVIATQTTINFSPLRPGADLTQMAPQFRITPGATISPASGSVHDFSQGAVVYTVTSEDGQWHRTYNVNITAMEPEIPEAKTDTMRYDFENFFLEEKAQKYYVWSDILDNGNRADNWATGNAGFAIAKKKATPEEYPTTPLAQGFDGNGVKLTTCSTGSFGVMMNMRIAAGNLFTGVFESTIATKTPLLATHFGDGASNKLNVKPVSFSGYYQYAPGDEFMDKNGKAVEGRIDEGDIYAVVFKNTDDQGNAFYLTGDNVKTSPQIIGKALSGRITRTENGWQFFDIPFEYTTEPDPQVLANYGYSIAIVFTSSCEGAHFEGAIDSTLLIDKVKVAYEKPAAQQK